MGAVLTAFKHAFRSFTTAGVPSSGEHEPIKSEIWAIGSAIEQLIAAGGVATIYPTTTAGLAATADGKLFLVQGTGDDFARLYKNVSGSAVDQNISLPSTTSIDNKLERVATTDLDMSGHQITGVAVADDDLGVPNLFQLNLSIESSAQNTEFWSRRYLTPGDNRYRFEFAVPFTKLNGANGLTYPFDPEVLAVFYTGLFAVQSGGGSVKASANIGSYAFFDRTGTYISGGEGANVPAGTAITKPGNAHFMAADALYDHFRTLVITESSSVPIIRRAAGFPTVTAYTNKRIGSLGDSEWDRAVANYATQPALCRDLGAIDTPFTNDAVSGRRFADCLPSGAFPGSGANPALVAGALDDLDVLLVLLGTNDWHNPVRPLGTYADNSSVNTTAGAIRKVFETIFTLRPSGLEVRALLPAKRFVSGLIPGSLNWDEDNAQGNKLIEHVELERQILGDFGVSYLSLFHDWPVNDLNWPNYMDDGTHATTAVGQPFMAYSIANWMRAA